METCAICAVKTPTRTSESPAGRFSRPFGRFSRPFVYLRSVFFRDLFVYDLKRPFRPSRPFDPLCLFLFKRPSRPFDPSTLYVYSFLCLFLRSIRPFFIRPYALPVLAASTLCPSSFSRFVAGLSIGLGWSILTDITSNPATPKKTSHRKGSAKTLF